MRILFLNSFASGVNFFFKPSPFFSTLLNFFFFSTDTETGFLSELNH